ncbi:MAG: hypothetical protein ACRC6V_18075 [Bacteroidales bacterium]
MNYIETEWIKSSTQVSGFRNHISIQKRNQLICRINKKAYEMTLRERKTLMNNAMRAGNYTEVSRHHKVINILRAQLVKECSAINGARNSIKFYIKHLAAAEKRRDQFERAYRLVEAADQLAMANAEIMNDVPIIPMADGDMEQIVKDLGY